MIENFYLVWLIPFGVLQIIFWGKFKFINTCTVTDYIIFVLLSIIPICNICFLILLIVYILLSNNKFNKLFNQFLNKKL